MPNIIRCPYGHYYDSDKSKDCPVCKDMDRPRERKIQDAPEFGYAQDRSLDDAPTEARFPENMKKNERVTIGGKTTRPPEKGIPGGDEEVTTGVFVGSRGTAVVTGWLVCVKGTMKGRDFRLHHENNWIGRSRNMDIILNEDLFITRDKHCVIVYDGKKHNRFFIQPGSGLTYLNEKPLEAATEIKLGDQIKMGESVFEFVPFCREGHTWEMEK